MIPSVLSPFADHVWQSTLFAGGAALLALALRRNRAQTRYWLWLAASVKFLVPFSVLVSVGGQFEWRAAPAVAPPVSAAIGQLGTPFTAPHVSDIVMPAAPAAFSVAPILAALWCLGCAVVLTRWWMRWRRIRSAVRAASPVAIEVGIPVMSSPTLLEPGVFGIFHPVLLLPEGIAERLAPAQLRAILAHELCHVRRRDNLAAAIHMFVEAVFWFHPLVWWIGARLVEERERACDEEVLRMGNEPQTYAESILSVCKFYLESPLACASGVTGADLKKRIEAIMTESISRRLTWTGRLLLAAAAAGAVACPILIGILSAPKGHAQSKDEGAAFEVASIKPADPDSGRVMLQFTPGGGVNAAGVRLKELIAFAYDVPCGRNCEAFISGGPGWVDSARFDIVAKAPASTQPAEPGPMNSDRRRLLRDQVRQRLQALLAERFHLVVRRATREVPVYALVVAKNGPKLKQSESDGPQMLRQGRSELNANGAPMELLARNLAGTVGRPVLDRTGLKGSYDFKLEWTPEPGMMGDRPGPGGPAERPGGAGAADVSGPSIFTALQEQLGLKLESTKGPVEVILIDQVEKPTEN